MVLLINELFYSIQGEGLSTGIPTTFIRTTGCNLRCSWCDTSYAYEEGEKMTVDQILNTVKEIRETHGHDDVCLTGGEPLEQQEAAELILRLLSDGYVITLETNGTKSLASLFQHLHEYSLGKKRDTIENESSTPEESTGNDSEDPQGSPSFLDMKDRLHVSLDIKCPSSGESQMMNLMNLNILTKGDQLKFVVRDEEDLDFAFSLLLANPVFCTTIIQPVIPKIEVQGAGTTNGPVFQSQRIRTLVERFLANRPKGLDIRFMLQQHKMIWGDQRGV
jgi:7-carboxy-7-deazaguanine synthase